MRGVVGWLHPGLRFAFQRQVRQMHRTHRTQGIIFADVVLFPWCRARFIRVSDMLMRLKYSLGL